MKFFNGGYMNKTVNSNSKELLPIVKNTVVCDLDVEGRIVCVNAVSEVKSTEALNKELRISLVTSFRVVTCGEDGEYELTVRRAESVASVTDENLSPAVKSVVCVNVADCSYVEKEGGRATAELEITGWYLKTNELNFLTEPKESVFCRTGKYDIENVASVEEYSVTLTNSNEARLPIKKILDCSTVVVVNNVYPAAGTFQLDGDVITRIIAVSDSGIFVTQTFTSPFTTEINSESVTADSVIDVYPKVTRTDLTVTETDERVFITDVDVKFLYAVSEKCEIDGIIDCYSTANELTVEEAINVVNTCSCFRSVRDKCSATVKSENVIEEVLCVNAPYISDVSASVDGGLKVEGLITSVVLFTDESGLKTEKCVVPFSTAVTSDYDCRDTFLPDVKITSLSARIRSATEIEVVAEICVSVRGVNKHEIKLVSSIETGAEKPAAEYAISLYIVKPGETIWDVSKALNTDEDTVFRLNPELSLPLKGGEKIIIYNELVFDI